MQKDVRVHPSSDSGVEGLVRDLTKARHLNANEGFKLAGGRCS